MALAGFSQIVLLRFAAIFKADHSERDFGRNILHDKYGYSGVYAQVKLIERGFCTFESVFRISCCRFGIFCATREPRGARIE